MMKLKIGKLRIVFMSSKCCNKLNEIKLTND